LPAAQAEISQTSKSVGMQSSPRDTAVSIPGAPAPSRSDPANDKRQAGRDAVKKASERWVDIRKQGSRWLQHSYYRWLLVFAVGSAAFAVLSWCLEPEPRIFWSHVAVELTVASLTLLLTVVVVERLLEHQRREERDRQWELVRLFTERDLEFTVWTIAFTTISILSIIDIKDINDIRTVLREIFTTLNKADVLQAMWRLEQNLIVENGMKETDPCSKGQSMSEWCHENEHTLTHVGRDLVPRFLQFAPDHPVMTDLLNLEADIWYVFLFVSAGRGENSTTDYELIPRIVKVCRSIYDRLALEK
jgi:hypothetical protein